MKRSYGIHLGYLLVVGSLFFMYRDSQQRYLNQRQASYSFRSQLWDSQDEVRRLQAALKQASLGSGGTQHPIFMDRQAYFRMNWPHFIYARIGAYHTGLFGGLKGIQLVLHNGTDYTLDQAVVQLTYLLSDGRPLQTIRLPLSQVQAGTTRSLAAPDSRRGVSLQVELVSLTSTSMNLCWDKGHSSGAPGPKADLCTISP